VIRQHLAASIAAEKHFEWRAREITRLEGFSDAVFAFAVTLLVVSLEVPKSFHELMEVLHGFLAFGLSFTMLALVWFYHCRFFRRYGLQDRWAIFLNCVLLFFVLFYVYPLKFLAVAMFVGVQEITADDFRIVFVVYGSGYAAVFLTFALLYWHAWRKRDALALNEIERMRTWRAVINMVAMGAIGLGSVLLAFVLPVSYIGWAGYFYFVIPLYFTISGFTLGRRERRLIHSAAS
jgi:uncharacterized membrane protein